MVEVCRDSNKASDAFGPKGKPEMQIFTTLTDLLYRPWNGWWIMMSDAVQFTHCDYRFGRL
jgi:hypothetical protein